MNSPFGLPNGFQVPTPQAFLGRATSFVMSPYDEIRWLLKRLNQVTSDPYLAQYKFERELADTNFNQQRFGAIISQHPELGLNSLRSFLSTNFTASPFSLPPTFQPQPPLSAPSQQNSEFSIPPQMPPLSLDAPPPTTNTVNTEYLSNQLLNLSIQSNRSIRRQQQTLRQKLKMQFDQVSRQYNEKLKGSSTHQDPVLEALTKERFRAKYLFKSLEDANQQFQQRLLQR